MASCSPGTPALRSAGALHAVFARLACSSACSAQGTARSSSACRRWLPAYASDDTLDALFGRELSRAELGAEQGVRLRMVGLLPTGWIAEFFNLDEIVRGVFQNAYASWSVNAEVARQGYATEGVRALLDIAFAPLERGGIGLHRVQANIIPENERSICLADRAGFRYEGLARRYLKIAGARRDHRMYAKTVEDHATDAADPPAQPSLVPARAD